jgi:hypothetical protein
VDEQLQELRERLERAEQQVKALHRQTQRAGGQARASRVAALALLMSGAVFAATRSPATLLRAQAAVQGGTRVVAPFAVIDDQGNTLVQVSTAPGGGGLLGVFDKAGNLLGELGTGTEGRGLEILDPAGQPAALVGQDAAGDHRGFRVIDRAGKIEAGLGVNPEGRGLTIFDETGTVPAIRVGEDATGKRGVGVANTAGNFVAGLSAGAVGGQLTVGSNSGAVLFSQPPVPAGQPPY